MLVGQFNHCSHQRAKLALYTSKIFNGISIFNTLIILFNSLIIIKNYLVSFRQYKLLGDLVENIATFLKSPFP